MEKGCRIAASVKDTKNFTSWRQVNHEISLEEAYKGGEKESKGKWHLAN